MEVGDSLDLLVRATLNRHSPQRVEFLLPSGHQRRGREEAEGGGVHHVCLPRPAKTGAAHHWSTGKPRAPTPAAAPALSEQPAAHLLSSSPYGVVRCVWPPTLRRAVMSGRDELCNDAVFIHYAARMQLIRGCQTPRETTLGRLRHPAPVLMTGAPGPIPVYRAPENLPRTQNQPQGLQRAATVETRTSSPRLHLKNLLDLHNKTSTTLSIHCNSGSQWSAEEPNHGKSLCATTGKPTTLSRNCNCGTSTVLRSWTRAYVAAHNGHDNLVQELHLWSLHGPTFIEKMWEILPKSIRKLTHNM